MTPLEAISAAAESANGGVRGEFGFLVRGSAARDGEFYFNSELNYRDSRCLTLVLDQRVAEELEAQLGDSPLIALKGQRIVVTGEARQVEIVLADNSGQLNGRWYYQTHVRVTDAAQIRVVP